jgi:hypothetical protein
MEFENEYLERLISTFNSFSVEGFNIFAMGSDHLPHLVCVCPNKDYARAIQSLLTIAKRAQILQALNAYVTSHCYLSPKILADGSLGMVATVINDAVYVNGEELEYNEPELLFGTSEYGNFVSQFLDAQEKEGGL